jgi:hypothetical protein
MTNQSHQSQAFGYRLKMLRAAQTDTLHDWHAEQIENGSFSYDEQTKILTIVEASERTPAVQLKVLDDGSFMKL